MDVLTLPPEPVGERTSEPTTYRWPMVVDGAFVTLVTRINDGEYYSEIVGDMPGLTLDGEAG